MFLHKKDKKKILNVKFWGYISKKKLLNSNFNKKSWKLRAIKRLSRMVKGCEEWKIPILLN